MSEGDVEPSPADLKLGEGRPAPVGGDVATGLHVIGDALFRSWVAGIVAATNDPAEMERIVALMDVNQRKGSRKMARQAGAALDAWVEAIDAANLLEELSTLPPEGGEGWAQMRAGVVLDKLAAQEETQG